jgi:ribosomal protein S18 acetylase RimI-like enzyme
MYFTKVNNAQIDKAYKILSDRIDELISMNTGQYIAYYPSKEIYISRNENNENWCLLNIKNDDIIGIVSITNNKFPDEWNEYATQESFYWINSLFISPNYKGNKYGEKILEECIKKGKNELVNEIYLDCYMDSGFLVPYYERNGFSKIAEKEFIYGIRKFNAALMKMEI